MCCLLCDGLQDKPAENNTAPRIQDVYKRQVLCVAILVDIFLANLGEEIGFSYDFNCTFSILVVAWLTLNELISILENLAKLGIPLPTFLLKTLKTFENQTEKADVETSKKTKD